MIPQLQGQLNDRSDIENSARADDTNLLMDDTQKAMNIQHIAGVIEQADIERLRRLIFRSTKGKSFMYLQEYQDAEDASRKRTVYIIVFWDGAHIRERIQRICDSFSGQRFELPNLNEIPQQIQRLYGSITDARNVYERTKLTLRDQLIGFDRIEGDNENEASSTIYIYKMFLAREKALYKNLNMMR